MDASKCKLGNVIVERKRQGMRRFVLIVAGDVTDTWSRPVPPPSRRLISQQVIHGPAGVVGVRLLMICDAPWDDCECLKRGNVMPGKLIMTRGLPASGKSTWASEFKERNDRSPGANAHTVVIVTKDDIRDRMHHKDWNYDVEKEVLRIRDKEICEGLSKGLTVISADTNFGPKHEPRLRGLAAKYKAEFEIKDFTHVPLETCLERDANREAKVGKDVIMNMYEKYLAPKAEVKPKVLTEVKVKPYIPDASKPKAIIVDIDGTIALMRGRGPYDTAKCMTDVPNEPVVDIVKTFDQEHVIILVSGREDKFRSITEDWLKSYEIPYDHLFMRPTGDVRNDAIVKAEIFDAHIRTEFNVKFVLDDRDRVVKMWRDLGLTCLQCAYGDF